MDASVYEQIVEFAAYLLALAGGVGTVPIVNWLKASLDLSGRWAQVATWLVATVLGVLTIIAKQLITPADIQPENTIAILLAVLMASQAEYTRIKRLEQKRVQKRLGDWTGGGE